MYFIKTRGTDKIPDYVQIRDDDFVLVAHFKTSNAENNVRKSGLGPYWPKIQELITIVPYGILYKL